MSGVQAGLGCEFSDPCGRRSCPACYPDLFVVDPDWAEVRADRGWPGDWPLVGVGS